MAPTAARSSLRGHNSTEVFIPLQTVSYTWTVVPTTIQDNYQITLQSDFVTNVPIPNLVPDKPFVLPLLGEGGSAQFTEDITNEGVIQANNVQIVPVNNPFFTLTPLITTIAVLPAQSEIAIPVIVAPVAGLTLQQYLNSNTCPAPPQLDISYSYTATDPVTQVRQITVDPVFVSADHDTAIQNAWGANTPSFATLVPDMFNSPNSAFLTQVLTTADNDLWSAQQNLLEVLANGLTGSASAVALDATNVLSGLCDITNEPTGGGSGGGGGGGDGGIGTVTDTAPAPITTFTPFTYNIPTTPTLTAQVRVEIDQDAVFTRDAFQGTLTIDNSAAGALSNIQVNLDIQTDPGMGTPSAEATDMFFIQSPQLSGLTDAGNGTFSLGGGTTAAPATGTATYIIIPTQQAAPTLATQYAVGGTLQYTQADGTVVNVPLLPAQITVQPSPDLDINYFWQQQVEGQNAVTPNIVQPSVPFDLGVQVTNIGQGTANNFTITSVQPKIVENQSGLLVGFNILGTTVNGQPASPSLTADFGNIAPGQTSTAEFILTSTLAGYFENFTATFEHDNALGGLQTSLINSVSIHNLVQAVAVGYVGNPPSAPIPDDPTPDFLVSDLPGSNGAPDTLYLSTGGTSPVTSLGTGNASVASTSNSDVYQVTADMPAGWGYFTIVDPTGGNLTVSQVERPDGLLLQPGDTVWSTVQNITSAGIVTAQNDLHFLDFSATAGPITYTVTFVNPNAVTPAITQLQAVKPTLISVPVNALDVTFNEPINLSTFTPSALTLTLNNGANLITANSGVAIVLISGSTYQITGLGALTAANGAYSLTVSAVGVQDSLGDVGGVGDDAMDDGHDGHDHPGPERDSVPGKHRRDQRDSGFLQPDHREHLHHERAELDAERRSEPDHPEQRRADRQCARWNVHRDPAQHLDDDPGALCFFRQPRGSARRQRQRCARHRLHPMDDGHHRADHYHAPATANAAQHRGADARDHLLQADQPCDIHPRQPFADIQWWIDQFARHPRDHHAGDRPACDSQHLPDRRHQFSAGAAGDLYLHHRQPSHHRPGRQSADGPRQYQLGH